MAEEALLKAWASETGKFREDDDLMKWRESFRHDIKTLEDTKTIARLTTSSTSGYRTYMFYDYSYW